MLGTMENLAQADVPSETINNDGYSIDTTFVSECLHPSKQMLATTEIHRVGKAGESCSGMNDMAFPITLP